VETDNYFNQLEHPFTWPASKMPLKVFIHPATGVSSYRPEFQQILESCFNEWSEASEGRVQFAFVNKLDDADIEIEWLRSLPKNTISHEIGVTDWKRLNGVVIKAHTKLLTVNADGREQAGFSIKQAALHELGHVLGIDGHSPHTADIMTLYYNFVVRKNPDGSLTAVGGDPKLTSRDKNTLLHLYNERWLASSGLRTPAAAPESPPGQTAEPLQARTPSAAPEKPASSPSTASSPVSTQAPSTIAAVAPVPATPAVSPAPTISPVLTPVPPAATQSASGSGSGDQDQSSQYKNLVNGALEDIKRGNYDLAIANLEQATRLDGTKTVAQKNLIVALTWKANRLYASHDYTNAADAYRSALNLRMKVNGAKDPKIAETMPAFVYSLRKSGLNREAEQWLAH
jgi:predicted Zn-dependent protease